MVAYLDVSSTAKLSWQSLSVLSIDYKIKNTIGGRLSIKGQNSSHDISSKMNEDDGWSFGGTQRQVCIA